jgi:hypothetical protein
MAKTLVSRRDTPLKNVKKLFLEGLVVLDIFMHQSILQLALAMYYLYYICWSVLSNTGCLMRASVCEWSLVIACF